MASEKQEGDDAQRRIERRAFFGQGLRNMFKPLAELVEKRLDRLHQSFQEGREALGGASGDAWQPSAALPGGAAARLLRPPGALEEKFFVDRCAHSSQCVSACPVQAIRLLPSEDPRLNGTPFIDPQIQACVVCEDLACMRVCPSGALQSVPRHLIQMGVAELRRDLCVRTRGEDCRICVEKCPIGASAIRIPGPGAEVEVRADGCVGCGVCEMYCPTEPRAIVIKQS
jgi:MauM/NapG family ferredoxin protein